MLNHTTLFGRHRYPLGARFKRAKSQKTDIFVTVAFRNADRSTSDEAASKDPLGLKGSSDYSRGMYVDVHAHLIHPKFEGEEDAVAQRALEAGLEYVIVNGLEPISNRAVLDLCERHTHLLPACGIYPVDAIAREIGDSGKLIPSTTMPEAVPPETLGQTAPASPPAAAPAPTEPLGTGFARPAAGGVQSLIQK